MDKDDFLLLAKIWTLISGVMIWVVAIAFLAQNMQQAVLATVTSFVVGTLYLWWRAKR